MEWPKRLTAMNEGGINIDASIVRLLACELVFREFSAISRLYFRSHWELAVRSYVGS